MSLDIQIFLFWQNKTLKYLYFQYSLPIILLFSEDFWLRVRTNLYKRLINWSIWTPEQRVIYCRSQYCILSARCPYIIYCNIHSRTPAFFLLTLNSQSSFLACLLLHSLPFFLPISYHSVIHIYLLFLSFFLFLITQSFIHIYCSFPSSYLLFFLTNLPCFLMLPSLLTSLPFCLSNFPFLSIDAFPSSLSLFPFLVFFLAC